MEDRITKLEQRVEQLEKILRLYNELLLDTINHIELETKSYYGDVSNNDDGRYHQALFEYQKVLEERMNSNHEN